MTLRISSNFCGGNIICRSVDAADDIRLEIARDNGSDFYQWFYFRLTGARGRDCRITIENAGSAAYPDGWPGYRAVMSSDLDDWQRVPTTYDGKALVIQVTPGANSVYLAYFAPYTLARHAAMVARVQASGVVKVEVLGQTLDGRDLDLLTVGEALPGRKTIWITARQHPGETMAEWWVEGFLERLTDPGDRVASWLLERAVFHVVPNMNPDGSARGHLRTNAAGVNLNREWQAPTLARSPEVYLVLERMRQTGLDLALDVHGDESLPYNFIAGTEGIPGFTPRLQSLLDTFKAEYVAANGDFQTEHGYPPNKPGKANMTICSNALAQEFDCLAMTLEMPFKDNANRPDLLRGWSPKRCQSLGGDVLDVIAGVLDQL